MTEPTRAAGLARLAAFVPRAGRAYRATRNEDRGPDDRTNVSMLAPYVRTRLITEEEILRAVLAAHPFAAAEKFVQEVFWRTYWKGWLEARTGAWRDYRRELARLRERFEDDADLRRSYEAAIEGRSGIPAFDAWASELVRYGYLHNHARMWFASIWIFTLRLPWELGADFFMRHLLCGDPASNTLSWRWVAGLHTRGKTYLATRGNIREYTRDRLDPGPRLATHAEPLDGPQYPAAPLPELRPEVPPGTRALLVLHDDDVALPALREGAALVSAAGLSAARGRSPEPARGPLAFARGALADALTRAPGGDPAAIVDGCEPAAAAAALGERARTAGVSTIVTPFAPVGPVRDALDALEPLLAARGVELVRVASAYDAAAWPLATRGFFQFKEKIPQLVRRLAAPSGEPAAAP